MTVPRTDPDLRAPASPAREESTREKKEGQLGVLQVAAGALAAVSAAVAASFFGVAGTVIGAAVASVVSTVGAAVYTESMRRTHAGLRRAGSRLVRRPQSPVDRSGGGRPPRPARLDPRRGPLRRRWRRWAMVAATGVAVFGLAMVVVTTMELIGHKPVSALVGGSDRSGGTTLGSLTATGGDRRQQQAPASPAATPTDGTAPASDSPPTSTSGDESTATSGAESTAPSAPTSSAPDSAPAEELPATPAPEQSASAPSQAGSNAEPGQPSSGVDASP